MNKDSYLLTRYASQQGDRRVCHRAAYDAREEDRCGPLLPDLQRGEDADDGRVDKEQAQRLGLHGDTPFTREDIQSWNQLSPLDSNNADNQ